MRALVAVGAAPVADPDLRPDGPTADDLPEMLGTLAAVIEVEIASAVEVTAIPPPQQLVDLSRGWSNQVGDDQIAARALIHRLIRTGYDMALVFTAIPDGHPDGAAAHGAGSHSHGHHDDSEDDGHDRDEPAAVAAAGAACHLAADFLQAHLHEHDPPTAIKMLDLAEGFLAMSLTALHALRLRYSGYGHNTD